MRTLYYYYLLQLGQIETVVTQGLVLSVTADVYSVELASKVQTIISLRSMPILIHGQVVISNIIMVLLSRGTTLAVTYNNVVMVVIIHM